MTKTGAPIQTVSCLSAPSWSAAGGMGNKEGPGHLAQESEE